MSILNSRGIILAEPRRFQSDDSHGQANFFLFSTFRAMSDLISSAFSPVMSFFSRQSIGLLTNHPTTHFDGLGPFCKPSSKRDFTPKVVACAWLDGDVTIVGSSFSSSYLWCSRPSANLDTSQLACLHSSLVTMVALELVVGLSDLAALAGHRSFQQRSDKEEGHVCALGIRP
jgi:hypothetical protein